MAQYIRTPFDFQGFQGVEQVSQTVYHDERVIEIDFDTNSNRVVVQNNGEWFYLTSPDIATLTMRNVFEHLGIAHEQIVVTMPENLEVNNLLDAPVQQAPLNQMAIYPPNQPIPAEHAQGPFPAVAGQPVPVAVDINANNAVEPDFGPFQNAEPIAEPDDDPQPDDDSDAHSEFSDMPNVRIVDRFGSDDELH